MAGGNRGSGRVAGHRRRCERTTQAPRGEMRARQIFLQECFLVLKPLFFFLTPTEATVGVDILNGENIHTGAYERARRQLDIDC